MAGKLTTTTTLEILHQLSVALVQLHSAHILHRNLHPDSVLLLLLSASQHVHVWLDGFGYAVKLASHDATLNDDWSFGDADYAAPEVLAGICVCVCIIWC